MLPLIVQVHPSSPTPIPACLPRPLELKYSPGFLGLEFGARATLDCRNAGILGPTFEEEEMQVMLDKMLASGFIPPPRPDVAGAGRQGSSS